MRRRGEIVERSFAHNLERGGIRRTWLRGRENVHKRYLIHVAGHNLGILMRLLIGAGTPKEAAARGRAFLFLNYRDNTLAIVVLFLDEAGPGILVVTVTAELTQRPHRQRAVMAASASRARNTVLIHLITPLLMGLSPWR